MGRETELVLFGGEKSWKASEWTASDDRVRGGKSQSYLDTNNSSARFHGRLDITALGGAGFASQRTTSASKTWDLSSYDGIHLQLGKSDGKRYTFIIKDELLPENAENGRDRATTSWEYDFIAGNGKKGVMTWGEKKGNGESVFVFWKEFKATYRGKEEKHALEMDRKSVKRFSIMMRSFFGDQEGDFELTVKSIKAVKLSKDLEKGFIDGRGEPTGSEDRGSKRAFRVASLVGVLALGVLAYGVCTYACPSIHEMHMKWHWR